MLNPSRLASHVRIAVICATALSVSLPMVWISLGKFLLVLTCLTSLLSQIILGRKETDLHPLWSVRVILLVLAAFAASLIWSEAPADIGFMAFAKHAKLLEIVLMVCLIRNAREARLALAVFLLGQAFFILSSWLMAAGMVPPWASSDWQQTPQFKYVVYSTYLDQTLIFSAAAAVLWHTRQTWPRARLLATALAVAALANNLFLQEGRTGYIATLTVLALALMWALPRKLRLPALLLAPMLVLGVYLGSTQIQDRVAMVFHESQRYAQQGVSETSSGFRLHAWRRSLQALAEQPLIGHGVGSWTVAVKRIEGATADQVFGTGLTSNPHQEYLLWGVELGLGGILLLLLLLASLVRDALRFESPVRRATLSVIAVMAVACLFNSSLYDALVGDFFCVTLGLLLALGIRHTPAGSFAKSSPASQVAT